MGVSELVVANVGPAVLTNVSASPSGSVPESTWSAVAPSATVMFNG